MLILIQAGERTKLVLSVLPLTNSMSENRRFIMLSRVKNVAVVFLVLFAFTLTGCGESDTDKEMKPKKEVMGKAEPLESKSLGIMEGRTSGPMVPVYFDFDSSEVRQNQVSRIELDADFMKKNQQLKIRIEGNCDPRGTSEYNMALGERRALSAKRYLVNLGVDEKQLSTISFGEERILLHGQDELAWAQNRRDDFVIVK